MPINAGPEYAAAEKLFYQAQTEEERLKALEEMLRAAPAHKGSEKFRGDIRLKIKKTKAQIITNKKKGKGKKKGIRKLTPLECARIQGFPEDYKLPPIADSALYKQFGNSVSVPVVEAVATQMRKAMR